MYGGQNGAMAVPLGGAIWTPGPAGQGIAPAAPPPMVVRPQGGGMMPDVDLAVTPTAGSVVPSALPAEAARVQEIRPVDQPRIQEGMPPSGIIPMQPGQAVRVPVAPARPPEVSSPVLNSLPPAAATDTLTRPVPPMAAPPAAMAPAMIAPSAMIAPVTAPPMAAPPVVEAPRRAASSERGTQNTPPRAEAVPPRPREETVDLRQRVMDARDRYDPTAAAPARNFSSGGPVIQFSAAPSEAAAHALWQNLTQKFPAVLGSRERIVVRVERNGAVFWRLRTDGFGSPGEARALCARLKASGQECIVPNS